MRKLMVVFYAAVLLAVSASDALACGAKIVSTGRGSKYERVHKTVNPSTILMFRNSDSKVASEVINRKLQKALTKAGHSVTTVDERTDLDAELAQQEYQLVVADLGVAESLHQAGTIVLPVVLKISETDRLRAEKRYDFILWAPSKTGSLIEAIEKAAAAQKDLTTVTPDDESD